MEEREVQREGGADSAPLLDLGATFGTGEQIVDEPEKPGQVQKRKPGEELPRKVVDTQSGKVLDLDTGEVSTPELIEISGVQIDASEFGPGGMYWLQTMYEQWLAAVQEDRESTFSIEDEGGVDSSRIIDKLKIHYPRPEYLKLLKHRRVQNPSAKGTMSQAYIIWNRHTTLEQWLAWTAATLRWRIDYEIDRRRITLALKELDVSNAKTACENCLIAAEKFLSLSERRRLISI
jgi:hypothetical protein